MSSIPLFLIVEGRKTDRPFFEKVLNQIGGLESSDEYHISLAEEILADSKPGSGKHHALELLRRWESSDHLLQSNSAGAHCIVLALDRDFELVTGVSSDSPHVMYTLGADAEADILRAEDIPEAIAITYSVTKEQALEILPRGDVFGELVRLYGEWILLGVLSFVSGGSLAHGRKSSINGKSGYDEVNVAERDRFLERIVETKDCLHARERVLEILGSGQAWRLVKGRWVAGFVRHCLESARADGLLIDASVSAETLVRVCLGMSEARRGPGGSLRCAA